MIPKVGKKRKQCTLIDFCSFILVGNIAPTSHLPLFTLNFVICSAIQYVQLQNPQDQGMIYHLPTWIIEINRWKYHAWTPWQHDMMLHDLSTPSGSYFKVDLVQCLCSTSDALGGTENAGVKGTWMMYISPSLCQSALMCHDSIEVVLSGWPALPGFIAIKLGSTSAPREFPREYISIVFPETKWERALDFCQNSLCSKLFQVALVKMLC